MSPEPSLFRSENAKAPDESGALLHYTNDTSDKALESESSGSDQDLRGGMAGAARKTKIANRKSKTLIFLAGASAGNGSTLLP